MRITRNSVIIILTTFMVTGMFSCDLNKIQYSEDDSESVQNEAVSGAYFEDVADISNTAVATPPETIGGRRQLIVADVRFSCATITLDIDSGSTRLSPLGRITIDFGSGCADKRGSTRAGKIIIDYAGRRFLPNSTITTTFSNYSINGVAMSGTYTVTNTATSVEAHPIFTISLSNGSLTWPNGQTATRQTEITREWIRTTAAATDLWYVTGQATGTNRNGKDFVMEVTDKLEIQKICQVSHAKTLPSSGKESLIVGNKKIDMDFGTGSCDQQVTININGKSKTVDLSKSL